jgi:hypothetical protein
MSKEWLTGQVFTGLSRKIMKTIRFFVVSVMVLSAVGIAGPAQIAQ